MMHIQSAKYGVLAFAMWLTMGTLSLTHAQHRGGGHHHHGGGSRGGAGIYIGSGGVGLSIGSGSPYRGGYYGGGYGGSRYVTPGYRGDLYAPAPRVYVTPQYVTPQYVTPRYVAPSSSRYYVAPAPVITRSAPIAEAPPTEEIVSSQPQPSSLPGVSFGARAHLVELADAVAERTNLLCVTLHQSYSSNANFKEVYRDTYLLITAAKQLRESSQNTEQTLGIVNDMNAILEAVTPAIESWQPSSGSPSSATSQLSNVASAVKLLSIDAGWEAGAVAPNPSTTPVAPTPESTGPVEPTPVTAPPPEAVGVGPEPTPIDAVPVP